MFRLGTVGARGASRAGTAAVRPVTAVRAAGYTSTRDTPSREDKKAERFPFFVYVCKCFKINKSRNLTLHSYFYFTNISSLI